jgi:uncharacterized protein YlxW (UPF0749 family)
MQPLPLAALILGCVSLQAQALQRVEEHQVPNAKTQQETKLQKDAVARTLVNADGHSNATGAKAQIRTLNSQIAELRILAGLTPVQGPGVRITLKDNPQTGQATPNSPFVAGMVHDYDILQVVNELRAAGAEAIAVNGIRITGYTPIRCVGPAIIIDGRPVPAPFVIEAIGDLKELKSTLKRPNSVVGNLRESGSIGVEIGTPGRIELQGASSLPALKNAKPVRH